MKKHIVLKNQDSDIYCFLNTIPKGERKDVVSQILNNALRGRVLTIPMNFVIKSFDGERHIKIDIPDNLVAKCEERLGFMRGKFSVCIKNEILIPALSYRYWNRLFLRLKMLIIRHFLNVIILFINGLPMVFK